MKRLLSVLIFTVLLLPSTVNAQANLQNGAQSLQPQQQQPQQQTGTVQEPGSLNQAPNNATIFSEKQLPALGVVSDPRQTRPDVTVPASHTTAVSSTPEGDSNASAWLFGGLVLAVVLAVIIIRRFPTESVVTVAEPIKTSVATKKTASSESATTEPKPKTKKKKSKSKKKHHR